MDAVSANLDQLDAESVKHTVVGYAKAADLIDDGYGHVFSVTAGGAPAAEGYEALMTVDEHHKILTAALIPDYSVPTLGVIAFRYWKDKFACHDFVEAENATGEHRRRYGGGYQPLIFLQDHITIVQCLLGDNMPTPEQTARLAAVFDEPSMSKSRAQVAVTNQVLLDQTAQFDMVELIEGSNQADRQEWLEKCAAWVETHGCALIGK